MQTSIAKQSDTRAISSVQAARNLLVAGLHHRVVLASAGVAATGAGLALGWDWLSAVGIAPLIVATAPCLIMCAFGMCMMGMGRGNQAGSSPGTTSTAEQSVPANPPSASEPR